MNTFYFVTIYLLSIFLIGVGFKKLFEKKFKIGLRIVNALIYFIPALIACNSSDWKELVLFQCAYFMIPLASVTISLIFTPFFLYLKKKGISINFIGILTGILYGALSIFLFLSLIKVFSVQHNFVLFLVIYGSHTLNSSQRILSKLNEEHNYEKIVAVGEQISLILGILYMLFRFDIFKITWP